MAIAIDVGRWGGRFDTDCKAIDRIHQLLMWSAQDRFRDGVEEEYKELRESLLAKPEYSDVLPPIIRERGALKPAGAQLLEKAGTRERTLDRLRRDFGPIMERAKHLDEDRTPQDDEDRSKTGNWHDYLIGEDGERITTEDGEPIALEGEAVDDNSIKEPITADRTDITADRTDITADSTTHTIDSTRGTIDSTRHPIDGSFHATEEGAERAPDDSEGASSANAASWTGNPSRRVRLQAVRQVIPSAQAALDDLIQHLEQPGDNGGPLLPEKADLIEDLRGLHGALGALLSAIDGGKFEDELGEGLIADTVRLTQRVSRALRDQPLPYAILMLTITGCHAAGLPMGSELLTGLMGYQGGKTANRAKKPE